MFFLELLLECAGEIEGVSILLRESAAFNMPANLENSAVATGLEKVSFHSNPKERQCKRTRSTDPQGPAGPAVPASLQGGQERQVGKAWCWRCCRVREPPVGQAPEKPPPPGRQRQPLLGPSVLSSLSTICHTFFFSWKTCLKISPSPFTLDLSAFSPSTCQHSREIGRAHV